MDIFIKRQEWETIKKLFYETRMDDFLYIRLGKDMQREIYMYLFSKRR